jgi:hypothetical protein
MAREREHRRPEEGVGVLGVWRVVLVLVLDSGRAGGSRAIERPRIGRMGRIGPMGLVY